MTKISTVEDKAHWPNVPTCKTNGHGQNILIYIMTQIANNKTIDAKKAGIENGGHDEHCSGSPRTSTGILKSTNKILSHINTFSDFFAKDEVLPLDHPRFVNIGETLDVLSHLLLTRALGGTASTAAEVNNTYRLSLHLGVGMKSWGASQGRETAEARCAGSVRFE